MSRSIIVLLFASFMLSGCLAEVLMDTPVMDRIFHSDRDLTDEEKELSKSKKELPANFKLLQKKVVTRRGQSVTSYGFIRNSYFCHC